jgi:hypothetical protein
LVYYKVQLFCNKIYFQEFELLPPILVQKGFDRLLFRKLFEVYIVELKSNK